MKINPISNINIKKIKQTNKTQKTNPIALDKVELSKNKNISFTSLKEVALKTQGVYLKSCANKAQKDVIKILDEAHKIQQRKEDILLKAQVYCALAQEALEESLPTIRATRNIDEKWNFQNLPPHLKSRTAKPIWIRVYDDNAGIDRPVMSGVHISEVRHDNTSRQIFVRDGEIAIHEFDEYENIKTSYNFDLKTLELKFIVKGLKQVANYQLADERYMFQNGEFIMFDEHHQVNNETTYEKGFLRFDFRDGELVEYKCLFEAIADYQEKCGQIFCFSDGKLFEYGEGVVNDIIGQTAKSERRIMFEPDEKLAFYILKDKDMDNLFSSYSKIFEFLNDEIKTICLSSVGDEKTSTSAKVFEYENGKLKSCSLNQKLDSDDKTDNKSVIVFWG